jgi:phosphoglycolate phosphatase
MYNVILFDLDGTLTDPKIGITKSVQYALHKLGITEDSLDKLTPFIGPPLIDSFQEFYHMTEAQAKQALGFYRERFSTVGLYENEAYPGMKELLAELKKMRKELLVATSKPTVFSQKILEHFDLAEYFTAVIGSNLDGTRGRKEEVIAFALTQCEEQDRRKILMVGDRKYDVQGAKINGIKVVAVGYGYGNEQEFKAAGADYIVDSVGQLREFLVFGKR